MERPNTPFRKAELENAFYLLRERGRRHEKLACRKDAQGAAKLCSPHMNPGDALAFTNFTVHATNIDKGVNGPRISIECRMLVVPS